MNMKQTVLDFFRRGFTACGFGPMVLAVLYLILQQQENLHTLQVNEVCMGIFSLSALAFIAGGMNVVYQIERLPLMAAISIHGCVLYISYLVTYLLNSWLEWNMAHFLTFTVIFVIGYLLIWAVIYLVTRNNTADLNEKLKQNRQLSDI